MIGIVAFAFGDTPEKTANKYVSAMASGLARGDGITPVFTQEQYVTITGRVPVDSIEERPGESAPTKRIARAAVQWALHKGIRSLYVVAATPHMYRALRDMRDAMREVDAKIELNPILSKVKYSDWFDSHSRLWYIRSKWIWWVYNTPLILMPRWLYNHLTR